MSTSIEKLKKRWMREPGFKEGYDALEGEFAIASMLIEARKRANLSQAQLAKRMGTSQSIVARLESGAAKPSLTTLERFAGATGTKVRVTLEPAKKRQRSKGRRAA